VKLMLSCVLNTQKGRLGEAEVIYFMNDCLSFICWQVKALGKGHRERKQVTYSEGVLASAAYSKPQVAEDQEGCQRRRRRPTSDDGAHEIDSGDVVSADMLPLHAETNQVATQHDTLKKGVPKPAVTTEARDGGHETPTNPTITVLRDKTVAGVNQQERKIAGLRKSNIHATKSLLTTLCQTLQFAVRYKNSSIWAQSMSSSVFLHSGRYKLDRCVALEFMLAIQFEYQQILLFLLVQWLSDLLFLLSVASGPGSLGH
jgi:hypothetical protein